MAVDRLAAKGWLFDDLVGGNVHRLDPDKWAEYVSTTWPELSDDFPSRADVQALVRSGGVFFGPFCGPALEDGTATKGDDGAC